MKDGIKNKEFQPEPDQPLAERIKIVFFGTPAFAVPSLKALVKEGYNVVLVMTQPDEPVGRKQILRPTPVKVEAHKLGLRVEDGIKNLPARLAYGEAVAGEELRIKDCQADLGIVVAYGKIIPKEILDLFPLGCLNIHPSLLPKYRGPSPIQAAILNGDLETGVTIIKLDEKMDHGEKLKAQSLKLKADDDYESLSQRLADLGAELLIKTLPDYLAGKIKPEPQDESQATYCQIIKKENGKIDWQKSAIEIERQIRAYAPWPGCYSEFLINGKNINIKITEAIHELPLQEDNHQSPIGQMIVINNQLIIICGYGALLIKKLQPAGKKAMAAREFINGYLR